jgi:hypothetical protein
LPPLAGDSALVFPSPFYPGKALSDGTLNSALARLGYKDIATAHGFRTLFSTCANEAGWNSDVIEKQLAHEERNGVRGAYNRAQWLGQACRENASARLSDLPSASSPPAAIGRHEHARGDHRLVVCLAQLCRRGDPERAHEVLHVELVSAAGARARLLLQPDFFFGDRGEPVEGRHLAAAGVECRRQGGVVGHGRPRVSSSYPIRPIQVQRDKPDYHVEDREERVERSAVTLNIKSCRGLLRIIWRMPVATLDGY